MGRLGVIERQPVKEPALECEELLRMPSLEAAVELIAAHYDYARHPYFVWMAAPSTRREDFLRTQLPFRFAVESFSRALAAVVARIPSVEARLEIVDNVAEEHGHGNLLASHKATFLTYLRALGARPPELARPCPTVVRAFNEALLGFCLIHEGHEGGALLGVIEQRYIQISSQIAHTLRDRGWCATGRQRHYESHETLDETHARDLLEAARPSWRERRSREPVAAALLLGAHWFWTLYSDLLTLR